MNKKVSVIIPTYGGCEYLRRCVDSVLSQTYNNIEIVVVDDNGLGTDSQMETAELMKTYEDDGRVRYLCHKKNLNGAAARNTGEKNSTGDYISLLDDDDVFVPEKIERQVKLLGSLPNDYAFVYCSHEVYKDDKLYKINHANREGYLFFEKASGCLEIQTSGILIRRDVYEEFKGFDESFNRHQDWEFLERVMSKYKIKADDFVGYRRFLYGRSDASSPEQSKARRMHYLQKMEPYFRILPPEQYKRVIYGHRIDIAFRFLKKGNIKSFIHEVIEIKLDRTGWKMLLKKIYNYII